MTKVNTTRSLWFNGSKWDVHCDGDGAVYLVTKTDTAWVRGPSDITPKAKSRIVDRVIELAMKSLDDDTEG